jgi:hypothetical protein
MDIWKVMIAVFIVGFSLIGLEDIGNRLEDPFGTDVADIPLNTLSVNAFHSIKETLVCHMLVAERCGQCLKSSHSRRICAGRHTVVDLIFARQHTNC